MKSNMQSILSRKHFFNIISTTDNLVKYTLNTPSQILLKNIYVNWLRYLLSKTQKLMPIYIQKIPKTIKSKPPFGYIRHWIPDYNNRVFEHDLNECSPVNKSPFELNIIIPKEDCMRYFTQWQRYRKYWWSSITTTPSLFAVNEIKQGDTETEVDIIAKLPIGTQPVEHIEIKHYEDEKHRNLEETSCLVCKMCLEDSLFILLLDGTLHSNDEYLRLHRTIAPYKISFALNFEDNKAKLMDLATILYYRLKLEKISVWLPDFSLPFDDQIKENLRMGITYNAILSENTLSNGIFHLMNSSTTLKEQVHVADFHLYASLICKAK